MILYRNGALESAGDFPYPWVFVAAVLCAILGAKLMPFFLHIPSKIRWLMLLSAAIFLTGTIGLEAVVGYEVMKKGNWPFFWVETTEEILEHKSASPLASNFPASLF